MQLWLINAGFSISMGLAGALAGWWIRGRTERLASNQHKRLVSEAMDGLQECTSKISNRVVTHADDMKKIMDDLEVSDSTDSNVIASAVTNIADSTGLVRSQLAKVEKKLQVEAAIIGRSISEEKPKTLFSKRPDRKERLYRKVMYSLEMLATELADDVDEHRASVEGITEDLESGTTQNAESVLSAVGKIMKATSSMQVQIHKVEKRLDEQVEQVEKYAKLAGKDELTKLPNRRTFDKELQKLFEDYLKHEKPFSLLMFDIDHFKKTNDQHGHQAGDAVLVQLGNLLAQQTRDNDIAVRYGGDEFAMLLPSTPGLEARLVAERIRKACLAKVMQVEDKKHRITLSVGVSIVTPDTTIELIVQHADQALYAAKNAGRDRTFWHDGTDCIAFGSIETKTSQQVSAKTRKTDAKKKSASRQIASKHKQAKHDIVIPPEFDLSNRSIFCVSLNQRLAECQRGGPAISLLLLRIDQTDLIGKQHGPRAVMKLRAALCHMLAAFTREMDNRCEFDAETYAILLPDTDNESVRMISERLRAGVEECQIQFGEKKWDLTACIGAVHSANGGESGMELMNLAEEAVQTASDCGGNTTYLADRSGVTRITSAH